MSEEDVLGALGLVKGREGGEVSPLLMVGCITALITFPNLTRRMLGEVLLPTMVRDGKGLLGVDVLCMLVSGLGWLRGAAIAMFF